VVYKLIALLWNRSCLYITVLFFLGLCCARLMSYAWSMNIDSSQHDGALLYYLLMSCAYPVDKYYFDVSQQNILIIHQPQAIPKGLLTISHNMQTNYWFCQTRDKDNDKNKRSPANINVFFCIQYLPEAHTDSPLQFWIKFLLWQLLLFLKLTGMTEKDDRGGGEGHDNDLSVDIFNFWQCDLL